MKKHPRLIYALLTLTLFAVEICIALFAHDNFVRPYLGDVLVVILIYCAVRVVFPHRPKPYWLALGVFLFGCAVEGLQAIHIVDLLGVGHIPLLVTVIGTSFSWGDILCYFVGCFIVGTGETLYAKRHHKQG